MDGFEQIQIHVPTDETPQPWVVVPRETGWGSHGGHSTRPAPCCWKPPQRVARARLAASPANEPGLEERTKTVPRPAAEIPRSKNAGHRPVDAEQPRRSQTTNGVAAAVPRVASPTLERLHAAQERTSCGCNPCPPLEPRGVGKEAASWI